MTVHSPTRRLIFVADRVNICFLIISVLRGICHIIWQGLGPREILNLMGNVVYGILLICILIAAARSYRQLGSLLKMTPLSNPSYQPLSKTVTLMAGITVEAVFLVLVSVTALFDPGDSPYWTVYVYGIRDIGIVVGFCQLLFLMGRRQRDINVTVALPPPMHSSLASSPGHTINGHGNAAVAPLPSPIPPTVIIGNNKNGVMGPSSPLSPPGTRPFIAFGARSSIEDSRHHLAVRHSSAVTSQKSPSPFPY
jgi:hypothetical protein